MERSEIPDLSRAPSSLLEALENHLAHMEGKKLPSQSSISRAQTEQDLKSFSRDLIFNDSDDPQKVLEEEANALAQFHKSKESSSPTGFPQTTTTASASGNGFGGTDFFSQQAAASNGQQSTVHQPQLLTDDLFSLATPPSQTSTNTFFPTTNNNINQQAAFPTFQQQPFQNALDTAVPKSNFFDDILQPTSSSSNQPLTAMNPSIPSSTTPKPIQGDLDSSLNSLFANLDMKDRTKIGKDHQWNPNDNKNQQKIGIGGANMSSPGSTWPNNMSMGGAPFAAGGGMPIQTNNMWQQPPPQASSTNPFAAPSGPSQTGFGTMGNMQPAAAAATNPFANPSAFGSSPFGQQAQTNQSQVNDPFGSL